MANERVSRGGAASALSWGRRYIVLAGLSLTAACGVPLKTDYQIARERAQAYVAQHPELDERTKASLLQNELLPGMTKEQVLAAWGEPVEVTRFTREELWRFGCDYPHYCSDMDPGQSIHRIDRIWYESWAIFEGGEVTRFHR